MSSSDGNRTECVGTLIFVRILTRMLLQQLSAGGAKNEFDCSKAIVLSEDAIPASLLDIAMRIQYWRRSRRQTDRKTNRKYQLMYCKKGGFLLAASTMVFFFTVACVSNEEVLESEVAPDSEMFRAGQTLLFQCIACHSTGKNEPHMQGPNLWAIFGAKAGRKTGFPYSEALKNSDIVWNDDTMGRWLEGPSEFIPGSVMAFIGIPDDEDRKALIAYLKLVSSTE
jgi:cytochrome c